MAQVRKDDIQIQHHKGFQWKIRYRDRMLYVDQPNSMHWGHKQQYHRDQHIDVQPLSLRRYKHCLENRMSHQNKCPSSSRLLCNRQILLDMFHWLHSQTLLLDPEKSQEVDRQREDFQPFPLDKHIDKIQWHWCNLLPSHKDFQWDIHWCLCKQWNWKNKLWVMKEFMSHLCGQMTNYKVSLQKQQKATHASHSSSFKGIRLKKKLRQKEEKGVKKGEGLKRNLRKLVQERNVRSCYRSFSHSTPEAIILMAIHPSLRQQSWWWWRL